MEVHCLQKQWLQVLIKIHLYVNNKYIVATDINPKKKKFDLVILVWNLQYFCSSTMGIATDILALAWGIFNIVSKKL